MRDFVRVADNREEYFKNLMKLARHIQVRASTNDAYEPYSAPGERWFRFAARINRLHYDPSQLTISPIMLHPHHTYETGRPSNPVAPKIFGPFDQMDSWSGHRSLATCVRKTFALNPRLRPKDLYVRILRRHHVHGTGSIDWEDVAWWGSPTCDQRDFTAQERELERYTMSDEEYDADARGKHRAIHEPADDLPRDEGDLENFLNSWEPFAKENATCSQCGVFDNAGCVVKI